MENTKKIVLTTQEKVELNNFLKQNAQTIGTGGRKEMFTQDATIELVRLREADAERTQNGEEPLSKNDRTLTLKNGVVKSVWRAKQEAAAKHEAETTRVEGLMESWGNEF